MRLPFADGETLVLDTSVVIAYLRGTEHVSAVARLIIDGLIAAERNPAVISSITVGEAMVGPIRSTGRVPEGFTTFLHDFPGLSWRSADFLIAAEAADIRAHTRLSLADALIAATATVTSSPWLITNDAVMAEKLSGFDWDTKVLLLSELEAVT